jgi:hypothetical protein
MKKHSHQLDCTSRGQLHGELVRKVDMRGEPSDAQLHERRGDTDDDPGVKVFRCKPATSGTRLSSAGTTSTHLADCLHEVKPVESLFGVERRLQGVGHYSQRGDKSTHS